MPLRAANLTPCVNNSALGVAQFLVDEVGEGVCGVDVEVQRALAHGVEEVQEEGARRADGSMPTDDGDNEDVEVVA